MNARGAAPAIDPLDGTADSTSQSPGRRAGRIAVMVVAGLVHAALGVTVSVSGLIMPTTAVRLLALLWIAGVVGMIRSRHRPALLLAVPVASWAVWFAVVALGEAWLGWTA